jgi:hypothetical protein
MAIGVLQQVWAAFARRSLVFRKACFRKARIGTPAGLAAAAVVCGALACCGGGGSDSPPVASASTNATSAAPVALAAAPPLSVGVSDLEFIGPFANWANVRTDFGAVGDGLADDTGAIQRGLDALRKYDGHTAPAVLYFPAGTYRITNALYMTLNVGANLVGADPAATTIVWNGPAGGTMLRTSGSFDTLFSRLTWDGAGTAGIGIAQWWNFVTDNANYQGSIKHIDEVFRNMGVGIYGGRLGTDYGQGDSETLIERVTFQSISIAGVNVGSFNAFNWWVWDSTFTNCARALSNDFSVDDDGPTGGAGNVLAYRNLFQGSTVADLSIANTGFFSLHNNVSIGSRQFIHAAPAGANGGAIIVQANTVLDTVNPIAIEVGNEGPLMLIDNRIRSMAGAAGPAVLLEGAGSSANASDRDVYSLGNQFTVSAPIALVGSGGRHMSDADLTVDRSGISVALPILPGTARNYHRAVYTVALGSNADQIQAVINAAAAGGSDNAVVHIPAGDYNVDHTLVVPANARLQIAGDSETTKLWWTGSSPTGTILQLHGPSYATLRDICLVGAQTTAIDITQADQPGGRVFVEGSRLAALHISGLARTRVVAQSNTGIESVTADASASIVGISGMGPATLSANSRMLVADSWYEGDRADLFRGDSGTYTYLGGEMAPYSHGVGTGQSASAPAIALADFAGQVNIIGATLVLPSASNGIQVSGNNASATGNFFGVTANQPGFFRNAATAGAFGLVMAKEYSASTGATDIPDVGINSASAVAGAFAQARGVVWDSAPFVHTAGATDVRLFRVFTANTAIGLRIGH